MCEQSASKAVESKTVAMKDSCPQYPVSIVTLCPSLLQHPQ